MLLFTLASLVTPAYAGCEVGTDYPTLQTAVDGCSSTEWITFGTYALPADELLVLITRPVQISAGKTQLPRLEIVGGSLYLVDGEAWADELKGLPGIAASATDLTIEGTIFPPNSWFSVDAYQSNVTISGVIVEDHPGEAVFRGDGGGLPVLFTLSDSTIARSSGHAINLADIDGVLTNVTFADNSAKVGGADVKIDGRGQTVTLDGVVSTGAWTSGDGGSVYAEDANLVVIGSEFYGSRADLLGGAVSIRGVFFRPEAHFEGTKFDETTAAFGGAIAINAAEASFENVGALHTKANEGGGFAYVYKGALDFIGGTVTGADADADADTVFGVGGAIYAHYSQVSASSTKFYGSGYGAEYGGIAYLMQSTLQGTGARYDNSGAQEKGGAIYAYDKSTVTLIDPTFHGNYAGYGGAIYADHSDVSVTGGTVLSTSGFMGSFMYQSNARLSLEGLVATSTGGGERGALVAVNTPVRVDIVGATVCGAFAYGMSSVGVVDILGSPLEPSRIDHSVFYGSFDLGSVVRYGPGETNGGSTLTIQNNDFVANNGSIADVLIDMEGAEVANNIFSRSGTAALHALEPVEGGWSLYDDVNDEVTGAGGYTNTSPVHGDPLFVTPIPGGCDADLHLSEGSPAIDAGDPDRVDMWGGPSDIGAFDAELPEIDTDPEDTDTEPVDTDPEVEDTDPVEVDDTDGSELDGAAWVSGGGGCDTTPRGAGMAAMLVALLAARRKR